MLTCNALVMSLPARLASPMAVRIRGGGCGRRPRSPRHEPQSPGVIRREMPGDRGQGSAGSVDWENGTVVLLGLHV